MVVETTLVVVAYLVVCLALGLTRLRNGGPIAAQGQGRVRLAGLSVLALPLVVMAVGPNASLTGAITIGMPFAVAAISAWLFAPAHVCAKVVPATLAGLGLVGLALARSYARGSAAVIHFGLVLAHPSPPGPQLILLEGYLLMVAGLWLIWRSTDKSAPRAVSVLRWETRGSRGWTRPRYGLLLIPILGIAAELLGTSWFGQTLWSELLTAGIALCAGALAAFRPTIAAVLSIVALAVLGIYGVGLAFFWPNHVPLPAAGTVQLRYGAVWVINSGTALVAGIEGLLFLAAAGWLVSRVFNVEPELTGRVERLTRTRADAVESAAAELRRVERDLHDGAQARLVALGMSLRAAEQVIAVTPGAALALVTEARETSVKALHELRDLVRGICPPVLIERGLGDAIRALALDTPLPVQVDIDVAGRLDQPVESACYFAVAEVLANAVKHSGALHVRISARHIAGVLRIAIADDGAGGADPRHGSGLRGLERRLGAFDGMLAVKSPRGGPTIVTIEVPCALSLPKISSS
jgi:signal transduction histidine kinase